jgi:alkylmercury lyase
MPGEKVDVEALSRALVREMPALDEEEQRVALTLYRLLAEGRPVPLARLASAVGLAERRAKAALSRWPGVFFDDGAVVGFWGLALPQMAHRFVIAGTALSTWCAWDALFLPELIGKTASVVSSDPVTGEEVALTVAPERVVDGASQVVISFLDPTTRFDDGVIANFCHYVHFFASLASGTAWVREHPCTFLLSLSEAFELGRLVNRAKFGAALEGAAWEEAGR